MSPKKKATEGQAPASSQPAVVVPGPEGGFFPVTGPTAEAEAASDGSAALVFEVAGQRYGLPVGEVVQIVEMVALTSLPGAPPIVAGIINYHGQVIPAIDVRRRLDLPSQPWSLRTPIVVASLDGHTIGLVVDTVSGVIEMGEAQISAPEQIFTRETAPARQLVTGVARLADGLLLILDLAAFLSPEEEQRLAKALLK